MLMLNHTDKEDSLPRSRPQSNLEKSPPRLVEISSNPGTPLKVTEIKASDTQGSATALSSLIMAPKAAGLSPKSNITPAGNIHPNSVSNSPPMPRSRDSKLIPNSGHVENGKPDTKVSPTDTNKNSEQRSANHTPSSSPPTSNNLVAVNT